MYQRLTSQQRERLLGFVGEELVNGAASARARSKAVIIQDNDAA